VFRLRRALRRTNLGDHAASRNRRTGAACDCLQTGVACPHGREQGGRGVAARISGKESLLVGEDHQRIGIDQVGDQRAQRVVVAKLDLVGHDRIVLVDDRHNSEFEQGA
jgi:hypothetical protein